MQVPDLRLKKKKKVTKQHEQTAWKISEYYLYRFYNININMSLPCIVSDRKASMDLGCIHLIMAF